MQKIPEKELLKIFLCTGKKSLDKKDMFDYYRTTIIVLKR